MKTTKYFLLCKIITKIIILIYEIFTYTTFSFIELC